MYFSLLLNFEPKDIIFCITNKICISYSYFVALHMSRVRDYNIFTFFRLILVYLTILMKDLGLFLFCFICGVIVIAVVIIIITFVVVAVVVVVEAQWSAKNYLTNKMELIRLGFHYFIGDF